MFAGFLDDGDDMREFLAASLSPGTSSGNKGYGAGVFGVIDDDDWVSGLLNTELIAALYWNDAADSLILELSGNNRPNNDLTFYTLTLEATTFLRSAATYNGSAGSNSTWTWSSVSTDPFASSPTAVSVDGIG